MILVYFNKIIIFCNKVNKVFEIFIVEFFLINVFLLNEKKKICIIVISFFLLFRFVCVIFVFLIIIG